MQAAVFDVVYSLKKLQLDRDLRLGVPTLFLEFLQWLILIFGPEWDWDIDWTNRYGSLMATTYNAQTLLSFAVLLQLVAVLQPLAIAACGCTKESSCFSNCVLSDDSSGGLHPRGVRIHSHVD